MVVLDVVQYGDPILRTPTQELSIPEIKSSKAKRFVQNMLETMYKRDGVGLAAPQVASNLRITVIDVDWAKYRVERDQDTTPKTGEANPLILINPKILELSGDLESEEGCLSFAGKGGKPALTLDKVKRAKYVKVEYQDLKAHKHIIEAEGNLLARCLQHEIDHLDGVLFIDKAIDAEELKANLKKSDYQTEYDQDNGVLSQGS